MAQSAERRAGHRARRGKRMLNISLKLSAKSRDMLKKMPGLVKPAIFKGMEQAMTLAEREARLNLSGRVLTRRTGRLRNSITHKVKIQGDKVIGTLGTNVIYGRIHELGGEIVPKNANALHFNIPGVGWRTAKKVVMPARPYLRPALEDNAGNFADIIKNRIEEAFKGI